MITLEQVREWCPEYTDERLVELAAGRASITVAESLDLPIPAEDRVWLLTRPEVLPTSIRREWIEVMASRAVRSHASVCGIAEVEEWAARWLAGEAEARTLAAAKAAAAAAAWAVVAAASEAAEEVEAAEEMASASRAAAAAEAASQAAVAAAWVAASAEEAEAWAASAAAAKAAWAARAWAAASAPEAERERQIADLRAILAAQGKETDRDSDHP